MYLTRFTRKDGDIEDYLYRTEAEAREHLNLFLDDDSGLYKNISVMDDNISIVTLCILPFHDGMPGKIISPGDVVRLKEEFSRPEERKDLYVVKNINEQSEHVQIMCITTDMYFKPIETVGVEMIEPV